ncbi:unnamed protein product, partial [Haemonchus placei]|uniref:Transposase n=1 Tax=Haemonchus placei TaxID=6290 RepID=A0A0N4WU93_HAEPC
IVKKEAKKAVASEKAAHYADRNEKLQSRDGERNDAISERFGVAPIVDKMREARLRWYGHVLRAKDNSVRKIGLNLEVSGKRPRGRQKQRWLDTLHETLKRLASTPIERSIGRSGVNISRKRTLPTSGTNAKE